MMNEENRNQIPQKGETLTPDQAYDCQMNCYRMGTLLKLADRLIDSLPIQETEDDRAKVEDARMVIQSARILLNQMIETIEIAVGFRDKDDQDKPLDL